MIKSKVGKGKFSSQKIIAIVVPIAVSVVLFFALCYCFLRWEAKKKYKAIIIQEDPGWILGSMEILLPQEPTLPNILFVVTSALLMILQIISQNYYFILLKIHPLNHNEEDLTPTSSTPHMH
ncbi:hypothetical protein L1049_007348 [Liquidambar formosana]|uniref:Uncharacterized protein n=1 Tax=Liquidambar formosana TaxID=63359 RepID=A0AAP0N4R2_LIQFO